MAAGSGTRMGSEIPKQFLLLNDKPVLAYSIDAFQEVFSDIEIRLVIPAAHQQQAEKIRRSARYPATIRLVIGGQTRFESVRNGLTDIPQNDAIIFVHDGVRSLVSGELIKSCYMEAVRTGTAIPVIPVNDSLRILSHGGQLEVVDREKVRVVQTPQTFRADILLPAYEQEYREHFTDESTVVEYFGSKVHFIPGEDFNIKITRRIDLIIAERILAGEK